MASDDEDQETSEFHAVFQKKRKEKKASQERLSSEKKNELAEKKKKIEEDALDAATLDPRIRSKRYSNVVLPDIKPSTPKSLTPTENTSPKDITKFKIPKIKPPPSAVPVVIAPVQDDGWNDDPAPVPMQISPKAVVSVSKMEVDEWGEPMATNIVTIPKAIVPPPVTGGDVDEWGEPIVTPTKSIMIPKAIVPPPVTGDVDEWGEPIVKAATLPPPKPPSQPTIATADIDWNNLSTAHQPGAAPVMLNSKSTPPVTASASSTEVDEWGEPINKGPPKASAFDNMTRPKLAPNFVPKPILVYDDWGDSSTSGSTSKTTSSVVDEWGDSSTTSASKSDDPWGTPSANSSSSGGGNDPWGTPSSTPFCSSTTRTSYGNGNNSGGDRGGRGRGRGRGRGGGGRGGACFKCGEEGHMSRECPTGGSGGRGGGRGGGGREPREGDWKCSSCSSNNFHWRTDCFKCQASKPEGLVQDDQRSDSSGSSRSSNGGRGGRGGGGHRRFGSDDNPNNEPVAKRQKTGGFDDWGASPSSSSAPASDEWGSKSASSFDDWGSSCDTAGTKSTPAPAPPAKQTSSGFDEWGTDSQASSNKGSDDWGAPPKDNFAAKPKADEWGTSSFTDSTSSKTGNDDWGSAPAINTPVARPIRDRSSNGRGGRGGSGPKRSFNPATDWGEDRPKTSPPTGGKKPMNEWICPDTRCGNTNFDWREDCFRCGGSKVGAVIQESQPARGGHIGSGIRAKSQEEREMRHRKIFESSFTQERIKAPPVSGSLKRVVSLASSSIEVEKINADTSTPEEWSYNGKGLGTPDKSTISDAFNINNMSGSLPLSYRFEAVAQSAAGGVGSQSVKTLYSATQEVLDEIKKQEPKQVERQIQQIADVTIVTPKTRNRINAKWISLKITVNFPIEKEEIISETDSKKEESKEMQQGQTDPEKESDNAAEEEQATAATASAAATEEETGESKESTQAAAATEEETGESKESTQAAATEEETGESKESTQVDESFLDILSTQNLESENSQNDEQKDDWSEQSKNEIPPSHLAKDW